MADDMVTLPRPKLKDLIRFFTKIEVSSESFYKDSPCWDWIGYIYPNGYGRFEIKKPHTAHRVSHVWFIGPVPKDIRIKQIDHLCRRRHCVNPLHLELVTPRVNTERSDGPAAINSRKTHCLNGHPLEGDNLRIDPTGRRICRTCKRTTPEYNRQRYLKRKENPQWQEWNKKYQTGRYARFTEEQKERVKQRQRKYQARKNQEPGAREKLRESSRKLYQKLKQDPEWLAKERERCREKSRLQYLRNKQDPEWRKKNRERVRKYYARKREERESE